MAQLALTRERHVAGFQQHGSSAVLPNFVSSSNSMSLSAVPALGELKKMVRNLVWEFGKREVMVGYRRQT